MNFKAILLATSALTFVSTASVAQADDWAGFYAGLGIVGLASGVMDETGFSYTLENVTPVTLEGFAGYNHVINHMLIGGEVVLSGANYQEAGWTNYHFSGVADARARVGYAGDGWLGYLFGGISAGVFHYGMGSAPQTGMVGTNFGVGVSAMVTDNMFIGVEFTQRNLSGEFVAPLKSKSKNVGLNSTTRTVSVHAGMLF